MATEKVRGYVWHSGKLKGKKASPYTRKAKPKSHKGIHSSKPFKAKITPKRDNQGRIVGTTYVVLKN